MLVGQARPNGLLSLQPAADTLIVESRLDTPYFIRFLIVPFLWNQQLTREAQTLLFIMVAVSFYVFLKFFISRWIASLTR
ncbi:MAG: hypothetical protein R2932_07325 [Caldilineaceae bacterium]